MDFSYILCFRHFIPNFAQQLVYYAPRSTVPGMIARAFVSIWFSVVASGAWSWPSDEPIKLPESTKG